MSQEEKTDLPAQGRSEGACMEEILKQWQRERPDLDSSPMAVCGEVFRAGDKLRNGILRNLKAHRLDISRFDVIMTLRRQGKGKTLSPSELAQDMMLSTSAMTNRLDRLEKQGLIKRSFDPEDRRALKISLTDEGFNLVEELVGSHVQNEANMLSDLSQEEQETLRDLLSRVKSAG